MRKHINKYGGSDKKTAYAEERGEKMFKKKKDGDFDVKPQKEKKRKSLLTGRQRKSAERLSHLDLQA